MGFLLLLKELLMPLNIHLKLVYFNFKWRRRNKHNLTMAKSIFPIDDVTVGNYSYGHLYITSHNKDAKLRIGHFCSIAKNVQFILCGEHNMDTSSTYPFKAQIFKQKEAFSKGDIIVGDDVWIGQSCIIMSGVVIGQGAIIAAGSVVHKNVPPYAVWSGRILKYRFSDNIIRELLEFDFGKWDDHFIKENINLLYAKINNDVLNAIKNLQKNK